MNKFFKEEKENDISEKDALEVGFVPAESDESIDDKTDIGESNAKKKELLQSFLGKRFTEIARTVDTFSDNTENGHVNRDPQLINLDVLEMYINRIVDEKIAQFEMKLKMEQELKENK